MSNDDAAAAQFDPEKDDDAAEEAAAVAAFAQNPDDISMEFPGENQVCLHVSDAYQAYAAEMGYTAYLDFFWMKNAFLIDYLADMIRGKGYQLGIISSKDGFVRCLDETGEKEYQYPLYHLSGNEIQSHGTMTYEDRKASYFSTLTRRAVPIRTAITSIRTERCARRILARQTEKTTRQHLNCLSIPVNMAVLIRCLQHFSIIRPNRFPGSP